MKLENLIKEYREEHDLTMEAFANQCGLSKGHISLLESGKNPRGNKPLKPTLITLRALAKGMNMELDDLIRTIDNQPVRVSSTDVDNVRNHPDVLHFSGTKQVRILGNIACGQPMLAVEEDEYVEVPAGVPYENAVRCKGNSMDGARIMDGDIVFIDFDAEVRNGDIAAVRIGDSVTLKKVYAGDNYVRLLSANPHFSEQYYHDGELEQIEIIGRAMSFWSKVR